MWYGWSRFWVWEVGFKSQCEPPFLKMSVSNGIGYKYQVQLGLKTYTVLKVLLSQVQVKLHPVDISFSLYCNSFWVQTGSCGLRALVPEHPPSPAAETVLTPTGFLFTIHRFSSNTYIFEGKELLVRFIEHQQYIYRNCKLFLSDSKTCFKVIMTMTSPICNVIVTNGWYLILGVSADF